MFKRKNKFREKLLEEKSRELEMQKEIRRQRRHKEDLDYCKRVCEEYKKEQARKMLKMLDRI